MVAKPPLSQEQMKRIEENRRLAMEKKLKRAAAQAPAQTKSPTKSQQSQLSFTKASKPAAQTVSPTKAVQSQLSFTNSSKPATQTVSPTKTVDPERETTTATTTPEKQPATIAATVTPAKLQTPKALTQLAADSPLKATTFSGSQFDVGCTQWQQYSSLYGQRLAVLRDGVMAQAKTLWSGDVSQECFLQSMIDFKKGNFQQAVMVGVLFKDLKGRPDVFKAYKQDASAVGSLPEKAISTSERLNTADDELWLEDSTLRIKLDLDACRVAGLCSGLVVGVRGSSNVKDEFKVSAMCFPQTLLPKPLPALQPTPKYIALLSNVSIGGADKLAKSRTELLEFLTRQSMNDQDRQLASSIQQVIICGGLFAGGHGAVWRPQPTALEEADRFLSDLSSALPVDLMPGVTDPTNLSLPQRPLLPHLFLTAKSQKNLRFTGNPFESTVAGLQILGHAGQPSRDVMRSTSISDPLSALLMSLEARHLAPTAPETLAVPPLTAADPFVISDAPHILFSGGHDEAKFEWRPCGQNGSGSLCLCVPAFSTTAAIVLVNSCNPQDVIVHQFGQSKEN